MDAINFLQRCQQKYDHIHFFTYNLLGEKKMFASTPFSVKILGRTSGLDEKGEKNDRKNQIPFRVFPDFFGNIG